MREHGIGGALVGQQADLGPVAVGDDQVVVAASGASAATAAATCLLLDLGQRDLAAFEQGVAAHRDHDAHRQSPMVATMAALMVWRRFSAWSKTIEAGDSKTSSVTSRARQAPLVVDLAADFGVGVVQRREAVHELDVGVAGRRHERRR